MAIKRRAGVTLTDVKAAASSSATEVKTTAEKPAEKPVEKAAEKPKAAPEKKETEKKAPVKSAGRKKADPEAKKADVAEEKKTAAKKTATKKAAPKKTAEKKTADTGKAVKSNDAFVVQFRGREVSADQIQDRFKDVWTKDYLRKMSDVKDVTFYIKPEDSAVYFAVNSGEDTGSFAI